MDREALAIRNMRKAQALHQPSSFHGLRDAMLSLLAKLPLRPQSAAANRLLVIRPDHLGDVLLSVPAIQCIKRERPNTEIHVLCGPWAAELLSYYDEIDNVLTLPFPGFQRAGKSSPASAYIAALSYARALRQIGYRSAIVMRPDHWWGAMLVFLAGIPERVGYDTQAAAPFLTVKAPHRHEHAVMQNLRLVEKWLGAVDIAIHALRFPVDPADEAAINRLLSGRGIGAEEAITCIHPGSGAASKLWQADKWAATADALAKQYAAAILFTGSSAEAALIQDIASTMQTEAHDIPGATTVGQLAALYRRSLLVLGPDSGAMHVAASVGTPTVTLFGPADPAEFAPWGDSRRHAVVTSTMACQPCRILDWLGDNPELHPCVRDISVNQVLDAARTVMQNSSRSA